MRKNAEIISAKGRGRGDLTAQVVCGTCPTKDSWGGVESHLQNKDMPSGSNERG